jgi:predicted nucleic acid-binding protein
MAANVLVDTSFLVAFLSRRDANHEWAATQASKRPLPWRTCEPVLSETFHILGQRGASQLIDLLGRRALVGAFQLGR